MAHLDQVHNQGVGAPSRIFLHPLEKCIGHRLKLLDTVQKMWAPLRNTSPLLVTQAGYGPDPDVWGRGNQIEGREEGLHLLKYQKLSATIVVCHT